MMPYLPSAASDHDGTDPKRPPSTDHPDRHAAQAEIHARPISPISAPIRVRRVALLFGRDATSVQAFRTRIDAFCAAERLQAPGASVRRFDFVTAAYQVTWELHTEFATVTWSSGLNDTDPWPRGIGLEVAGDRQRVLAVRIDVLPALAISPAALAGFDESSLCHASVEQGRAQIATDFLLDAIGYTRYEVAGEGLGSHRLGMLVRRLLEIETYRVLALVGIGLARSEAPRLSGLEGRLASSMQDIGSAADPATSAMLLDTMHDLQVEAARSVELTRYRFAASHAYGDILIRRLRDLDERSQGDQWTLQSYLTQRIEPALATFEALERRQSAILEQSARSTALLGTRISLDIDTQNRSILGTILDTAKSQFKLQRTVEGLSTIAIAYYLLGIVGYALHGLAPTYEHEKAVALAILAPLLIVAVWLYLRRVQNH